MKPKPLKKKIIKYLFKISDMVRISRINMIFDRSSDETFTREIFKIRKLQAIPMYRIKHFTNEPIKGNFNESELQKVDKDGDTLWYIEKKIRKRKRNCNIQWLVKFEE